MKLEVGQKVWLKPLGNQARRSSEIVEGEIAKVGRRYFSLTDEFRGEFHIDTLTQKTDHTANWQAYLSKQAIEDEREAYILYGKIRGDYFNSYSCRIPLDQLRAIHEILNTQNQ